MEKRKIIHNARRTKNFRRELRTHGTSAEAYLWLRLKGHQLEGYRFRRQFAIGSYILDFYCPAAHLGIELDGQGHFEIEGEEYDRIRSEYLWKEHNIRILRFENKEIFNNLEQILKTIKLELLYSESY